MAEGSRRTEDPNALEVLTAGFHATVELLRSVHEDLARRHYPDGDERRLFHEALLQLAAVSVRYMTAAETLVQLGWVPECGSLIRPLYEAARDAAFLLSTSGRKRKDMAGRFQASRVLRAPDPPSESLRDAAFKDALRNAYPGKSWGPNDHWSGLKKEAVARAAEAYWRGAIGDFEQDLLKRILFRFPSVVGHPDPGGWSMYPIELKTCRIQLEPGGQDPRIWLVIGIRGGVLLAMVLAKRLPTNEHRANVLRRAEHVMGAANEGLRQRLPATKIGQEPPNGGTPPL